MLEVVACKVVFFGKFLFVDRPRWEGCHEQKMLKGHLPLVTYHQVCQYTKMKGNTQEQRACKFSLGFPCVRSLSLYICFCLMTPTTHRQYWRLKLPGDTSHAELTNPAPLWYSPTPVASRFWYKPCAGQSTALAFGDASRSRKTERSGAECSGNGVSLF